MRSCALKDDANQFNYLEDYLQLFTFMFMLLLQGLPCESVLGNYDKGT
jgi:hypothetical protein